MAGRVRGRKNPAAVAALLIGVAMAVRAQSPDCGSVSGKLTDLHSAPLSGVTVVLRNQVTGAEARMTTQKNGLYRFIGLGPGEYTLDAESQRLGSGHVDGILVSAGHESHVQTAIELVLSHLDSTENVSHPAISERSAGSATASGGALQPLSLPREWLANLAESKPEPSMTQLTARLEADPLRQLAVRGRSMEDWLRGPLQNKSVALNTPLETEPMQTLTLIGRDLPQPIPVPTATAPSPIAPALPAKEASATSNHTPAGTALAVLGVPGPTGLGTSLAAQPSGIGAGFVIGVAAMSALRIELEFAHPGSRSYQAALHAAAPASPMLTTTIPSEQLQSLPVGGRRWQEFALETPTGTTQPMGEGDASLQGLAQEPAAVSVDGAGRGLVFDGGSGGWMRGRGPAIGEAAIHEVQTESGNAEVRGARSPGERMNVDTPRGSNGLHGQGFLFDRQNTWGAQNPFSEWVKESTPATLGTTPIFTSESYTPPDHETTWGIGLGSHIRRDRLFWFAALDSYQRNDPGLATVKHPEMFFAQPSNDQMQVLSARLGLSSANPVAAGLAAYSNALETLAGLLGPAPRTATQWTIFGRIDWEAAERHRFTLEGTCARWNSPGGGLTRVEETFGSHSFGSSEASEEWLLARWEAFLTPNLLAVTQGSAGRTILSVRPETPSTFEQTLVQQPWGQLPQMVIDPRYGFTVGNPARFGTGSYPDERLYQAQETLDWARNSVLLKAGFDFVHSRDATSLLFNQTGTYSYANVENFVSDALVFGGYGISGELNPMNPRNCDQTGKVWRDSAGNLRGLGNLPCYSYYSQVMGPTDWWLATNDWAGFATAQWQAKRTLVFAAGLRWERQQMPPPIASLRNPELPLTEALPSQGPNWGPRFSLAWGAGENHWPVLRVGYGMYFGQTNNATLETVLTQTGSSSGDLNFFLRPTDNLNTGGAPPFPYVLTGEPLLVVKPGAVEFSPTFRAPEVHQAVVGLEETLPGHLQATASATLSLGRRLPISIDTNFDPKVNPGTITYGVVDGTGQGPIKAAQIKVPFYAGWPSANSTTGTAGRLNPDYQQITQIVDRANSTYEAAMLKVARYGRRGLTLRAHYTYAHAMDWNPNESTQVAGSDVLDPANFGMEYGTSNLDVRHSASAAVIWEPPWKLRSGPHSWAGRAGNGWMLSGIGRYRSGLPYTMRTAGSLAEEFQASSGAAIVALGPGMNGSGGDNRVYGVGSDTRVYNIGRNTFRYPPAWKADLRLGKRFDLGPMRQLELLAESFNLFNHQNVTEVETVGYSIEPGNLNGGFPTLNFLTGLKANTTAFGQPLNVNATDFYRERQVQIGLRLRF